MIIEPPYLPEWAMYERTPPQHRWIYNKIELQNARPVGMRFPPGEYCVRPIINLMGMASGGFKKVVLEKPGYIQDPPGYCVTPWNDGFREWHMFVNDKCWYSQKTVAMMGNIEQMEECEPCASLPDHLCGISRYMMVETLGNTIIDVSPRHMVEEMKQEVIDDYQIWDPTYEAPSYGKWGFQPLMGRVEKDGFWYLEEIEND